MNVGRIVLFALAVTCLNASADPWKDESGNGKGRGKGREYKEEYWEGNCKVERKLEKSGEYKEERKCKPHAYDHRVHPQVYEAPGHPVIIQPGVTIHGQGTVRVP